MNMTTLQEDFKLDVKTLKTLDVEILPAKVMYAELARLFMRVLFFIVGSALASVLFILLNHTVLNGPSADLKNYEYSLSVFFVDMGFSILASLGICLLLSGAMNKYILFRRTLKTKMRAGCYIDSKIKQLSLIAWLVFTIPLIIYAAYFGLVCIPMVITAFFSLFIIPFILQFEVQRLGLNIFFNLVSEIMEQRGRLS